MIELAMETDNSYTIHFDVDHIDKIPSKELLEVLFYQHNKFRRKIDFLRRFRKRFFKPLSVFVGVSSIFLLMLSIFILVLISYLSIYAIILAVLGLFISLIGLSVSLVSLSLEKLKGKGYRKMLFFRLIRLRYFFFRSGLKKRLPYKLSINFSDGKIILSLSNSSIIKEYEVKNYKKAIYTNDGFYFFQRDFSPSYKFSVQYNNLIQKEKLIEFLKTTDIEVINFHDLDEIPLF